MKLMERMIRECRKLTGAPGRFVARLMNRGHSKATKWGLGHVSVNRDDTILDVGCGGGETVNTLVKKAGGGKTYGIDYSEDCVAVARKINRRLIKEGRVEILHGSVASLSFPDDSFDLVTAVETYYFWPDLIKNLREIRRVLKPGGFVVLINEAYRHDRFEERNAK